MMRLAEEILSAVRARLRRVTDEDVAREQGADAVMYYPLQESDVVLFPASKELARTLVAVVIAQTEAAVLATSLASAGEISSAELAELNFITQMLHSIAGVLMTAELADRGLYAEEIKVRRGLIVVANIASRKDYN